MKNNLTIFEGQELEILTKEDVNIEFEGTVLFNGKQAATILEYKNPSTAITEKVKEKYRIKLKNLDFVNHEFRKLNNAGENFITEKGVFALIMQSDMPKAEEFQDLVYDIVAQIKSTGKFDIIENNIKQIEDETERELSLGLYSMQQALKSNPNDYTLSLLCKNKEIELKQYKQDKRIEEQEKKLIEQGKVLEDQKKKLDNIFVIGDRIQFVNEVNRVARATGKQQSEIYSNTYSKLKFMYGIDLNTRVKNRREELQNERLNEGKKAYSPATLKNKINNLTVADELSIWNELGRSLNAVNDNLLI